jgi:hypothetical protein
MRIPFLAGWFDRSKERTRIVVAEGRVPRVFPGPWRLEAVVREDDDLPPGPIPPGDPRGDQADPDPDPSPSSRAPA